MLTGLLARRWCKSPKAFVYDKFAERKPGLDKGQGLLTLHDSTPRYYPLCTTEGIKAPFKNKVMGLAHQVWSPHVILFFLFSFSLSVLLSGWLLGTQGLSGFTFLPGLLRPDWEGALRLHQGEGVLRPHPTERAPAASVNRASSVSGALLPFCVNQGRSSLLLSPFTFLIANAILLRESLAPTRAGP